MHLYQIKQHRLKKRGFSLTELMIALVLGLIVIGGVGKIYLTIINSSSDTLKTSKLNYETSVLMSMMVNDIRRSGYHHTLNKKQSHFNIFNQVSSSFDSDTTLSLRTDSSKNSNDALTDQISARSSVINYQQDKRYSSQCVLYSYDHNLDGILDNNELFGFRLKDGFMEARLRVKNALSIIANTVEDSCHNGTWYKLTEDESIVFTQLEFSLAKSTCLNFSKFNGLDDDGDGNIDEDKEINCYNESLYDDNALSSFVDEVTIETRLLDITLTAQMVSDKQIKSTISNQVRIRNDLIRLR